MEGVLQYTKEYEELATGIPNISKGVLFDDSTIQITMKQRDLVNNKWTSSSQLYFEAKKISKFGSVEPESVVVSSYSPSRQYLAQILKKTVGENSQFELQIWNQNRLVKQFNLNEENSTFTINKISSDEHFTRVDWNSSEEVLLLEADISIGKKKKLWEQTKPGLAITEPENKNNYYPYDFEQVEDYGEGLVDLRNVRLLVISWKQETDCRVKLVDSIPEDLHVSFAAFSPDEQDIVFTGYSVKKDRRLGLKYCFQRQNSIYSIKNPLHFNEKCEPVVLSGDEWSARCPSFSPDGKQLAFITTGKIGSHNSCTKLMVINWSTKEIQCIVDIVGKSASFDEFPGLFVTDMSKKNWTADSKYLILTSGWYCTSSIVIVNCISGKVTRLSPYQSGHTQYQYESLSVIDFNRNTKQILAVQQSPNNPFVVLVGDLKQKEESLVVENWKVIQHCHSLLSSEVKKKLENIEWSVIYYPSATDESIQIESIVLKPKQQAQDVKSPLIGFYHGGPASATTTAFLIQQALLTSHGFWMVEPNYRGSTQYGQEFVTLLPGNCGEMDVQDCHKAIEVMLKQFPNQIDQNRIGASGGSHGGFLSLHLVGQYPEVYKACSVRNPVTNISSMFGSTDIPDWCLYESGYLDIDQFTYQSTVSVAKNQLEKSPIIHVDKVKAAVLLAVGAADLRVPPSQAKEYYYAMKRRAAMNTDNSVICKMMWYPKNDHPIASPSEEADCFIHTLNWFKKYLSV